MREFICITTVSVLMSLFPETLFREVQFKISFSTVWAKQKLEGNNSAKKKKSLLCIILKICAKIIKNSKLEKTQKCTQTIIEYKSRFFTTFAKKNE